MRCVGLPTIILWNVRESRCGTWALNFALRKFLIRAFFTSMNTLI